MGRGTRQQKRNVTYMKYYRYWKQRIMRLADSAVQWEGLPSSIDTVYMERVLNTSAASIIVYDEVLNGYFCGQNASVGQLDIYGYPMNRSVIFRNGQQAWYTPDTSVIIYNNEDRIADIVYFNLVAERMADFDMAINVNMNSQKTMPIIPADMNQKLTIENLYNDVITNMPYAIIDPKSMDMEGFKNALQFDNRKSFTADAMIQVQQAIWNWFLTFIGVNNVNNQKKERLIVPEASANDGEVYILRRSRLNARERACQQMKNLWGWNVSVKYYADEAATVEGGNDNGNLYNRSENDMRTTVYEQSGD